MENGQPQVLMGGPGKGLGVAGWVRFGHSGGYAVVVIEVNFRRDTETSTLSHATPSLGAVAVYTITDIQGQTNSSESGTGEKGVTLQRQSLKSRIRHQVAKLKFTRNSPINVF